MSVSWSAALSWRLRQQLLNPIGTASVADVVRRLGAVPASAAELAIRVRRARSRPGEVARALAEGRIIKTYAFRGATHVLTREDGGAYLALRAASRMWELSSWQGFYGLAPEDWPSLRKAVREALADGPMTRDELGAAVTARRTFRHLVSAFDGSDTLLKPLAWQGDMSFGPPRDGRATFQRLDTNPRWAGLLDLDRAGQQAVETYFRAYGPATPDHVHYWLGEGLGAGRKRIQSWIADLGNRLAKIDVDGETAYVLREDLDELTATPATSAVRLLPGYDQWVLGPGTADPHVVPPARRKLVSRKANLVIVGGFVSGTWTLTDDEVVIAWFARPHALRRPPWPTRCNGCRDPRQTPPDQGRDGLGARGAAARHCSFGEMAIGRMTTAGAGMLMSEASNATPRSREGSMRCPSVRSVPRRSRSKIRGVAARDASPHRPLGLAST